MNIRPLVKLLVNRPKTVFFVFIIFTVLVSIQATNIYMQSDLTEFLPEDDPTIQLWSKIYDEFEIGSTIIIFVETDELRDPDVLKEMDRVCTKINEYENDEGKIDGVYTIQSLSELIKDENGKTEIPGTGLGGHDSYTIPTDITDIYTYMARTIVQETKGILYTKYYDTAVIIIQLYENADYDQVLSRVEDAIDHRGSTYTEMTITGTLAMQRAIREESMGMLTIVFPIAFVLVSIVLFLFHRTFKGIIIAFLPPACAIGLTFGILGVLNPEVSLLSISVVALLMGLGVDYSIHLMNRFAEEKSIDDKIERMEKTLKNTGKAVLLSTVTTMIGFGSLMISSMSPIVSFGFSCAIGILFCFISAIILVPCLVLILKFEKNGGRQNWKKFADFTFRNRHRVIIIAIFFAVMSLVLLPQVKTDVDYLELAPEGIPEIDKLMEYSRQFGGGTNFNAILIETEPQGLTYPETIEAIYNMEVKIQNTIGRENVTLYSIADSLKEINDILERKTIIKELADYVGIQNILLDKIAQEGIIDEEYSKALVMVYIPLGKSMDELEYYVSEINHITSTTTIPHYGRVSMLTGQDAVNVAINKKLTDQQTRSMIIALLLVLAALIIIFNSSLYGFLTMIPVGFVLIWEPGFLVALNIPLSVITISIASIMIGIGIDYGVHITQRVREELKSGKSKEEATKTAIEKTGLSLVEAASTTMAGIISIYAVNIPALQEFGLVVILMTGLSCIAAALILPAFFTFKFGKK